MPSLVFPVMDYNLGVKNQRFSLVSVLALLWGFVKVGRGGRNLENKEDKFGEEFALRLGKPLTMLSLGLAKRLC